MSHLIILLPQWLQPLSLRIHAFFFFAKNFFKVSKVYLPISNCSLSCSTKCVKPVCSLQSYSVSVTSPAAEPALRGHSGSMIKVSVYGSTRISSARSPGPRSSKIIGFSHLPSASTLGKKIYWMTVKTKERVEKQSAPSFFFFFQFNSGPIFWTWYMIWVCSASTLVLFKDSGQICHLMLSILVALGLRDYLYSCLGTKTCGLVPPRTRFKWKNNW